jgi:hypothetical protein
MITEILNIIGKGLGIAGPILQDHQAKRHENDLQHRLSEYQDICTENDPDKRADRHRSFDQRLCLDAGYPARQPLSGTSIEIPVEVYDSFVRGQCELIKVKGVLNDAIYAANHQQQ